MTGRQGGLIAPSLLISNQAVPGARTNRIEYQGIISRISRFKEKNFNQGSAGLTKREPGLDDPGVIPHHDGVGGNQVADFRKPGVRNPFGREPEQPAFIPVGQGKSGNPVIRKIIQELFYMDAVLSQCQFLIGSEIR